MVTEKVRGDQVEVGEARLFLIGWGQPHLFSNSSSKMTNDQGVGLFLIWRSLFPNWVCQTGCQDLRTRDFKRTL